MGRRGGRTDLLPRQRLSVFLVIFPDIDHDFPFEFGEADAAGT